MAGGSEAPLAAVPIEATLYKNPSCTCCESYAQYLEKNGFKVTMMATNDLAEISQRAGVPEDLEGCHTMFVGGYVVDGHVPVEVIRKLGLRKSSQRIACNFRMRGGSIDVVVRVY